MTKRTDTLIVFLETLFPSGVEVGEYPQLIRSFLAFEGVVHADVKLAPSPPARTPSLSQASYDAIIISVRKWAQANSKVAPFDFWPLYRDYERWVKQPENDAVLPATANQFQDALESLGYQVKYGGKVT